jgi:broad specificity phosphatase PhoE
VANAWFRNFQVGCDGVALDPTQAFNRYSSILEGYERSKAGDRAGWIVEMDRFWSTQAAGGDPITIWLSQPLQYFEPAALVVRRFWRGIVEALSAPDKPDRLFVATHSGPIRAVAAAGRGSDERSRRVSRPGVVRRAAVRAVDFRSRGCVRDGAAQTASRGIRRRARSARSFEWRRRVRGRSGA